MEVNTIKARETESSLHDEFSPSIQSFMGTAPSWPVRYGAMVIAGIFLIALLFCCIIRYPETVDGSVYLTVSAPASRLISRYTSVIDTLVVNNGEHVMFGDDVAVLRNAARYKDIRYCMNIVDEYNTKGISSLQGLLEKELRLGDIQDYWSVFLSSVQAYNLFVSLNEIDIKKEIAKQRIDNLQDFVTSLANRIAIQKEILTLKKNELNREKQLLESKMVSQSEYETYLQDYRSAEVTLNSLNSDFEQTKASIHDIEYSVRETELEITKQKNSLELSVNDAALKLSGALIRWKENYAIVAPVTGKVNYMDFWNAGQTVMQGQIVASIIPDAENEVFAIAKISSQRYGKIREGQRVNIRLNGFPYNEFGILKGEVEECIGVPEYDSQMGVLYTVRISLPEGMTTSYNKQLPIIMDMNGVACIEVEPLRLIYHIITPIKSLFLNR